MSSGSISFGQVPLLINPSIHKGGHKGNSERFSFTSLAKFAEQASLDKDPSDPNNNIFSLKEEIIAAKYSFSFFLQHMDKLQVQLSKRITESIPDPNDPPDVVIKKRTSQQAAESLHSNLMTLSGEILELSNKVARIVKQGIEVEAIKATRFDGVQVLFILQQIPPLLEELFNFSLEAVLHEIRRDILEYVPQQYCELLFSKSKILSNNPVISNQALDGVTNILITNFNKKLEQLKVAYARNSRQDELLNGTERLEREEAVSSGELGQLISSLIVATSEE